ncbi:eCIS core domain-containing protein [Streptomyces beihaiensis]|uniref:DUF4157 domain-containing protein n=1 Tax=Streptomyces beihaiensis TaxID=2984495 RepID=A0ABT3TML2_9ACTN|nr:DUF4157 domain-containing protein [Streptomyces beihaiensis]MCX3058232.1 DUF4157 domain-containing protein [Streptomyces beihaiensis]
MPAALTPQSIMRIQRNAGNAAAVRLVARQRHAHGPGCGHGEETTHVQRSTAPDVLRSSGKPLDGEVRGDMEGRLGADFSDFSDVRVHDDGAQREFAAEVGGPVAGTDNGGGLRVSDSSDRFERAADANANAVRTLSGSSPVQRVSVGHPAAQRNKGAAAVQRMPKETTDKRAGKKSQGKAKKSRGKTVAEALMTELVKLGWKPHGANQSLTIHKPAKTDAPSERSKAGNLNGTAKARIYGDTANLKEPRPYPEDERSRQSTRWITTLALNYLNGLRKAPEEVQATVHEAKLYISANKNTANDALRALAEETQTGSAFLRALIDGNAPESLDGRSRRHRSKAESRLTGEEDMSSGYQSIIRALSAKVEVPAKVDKENDGLHAERRLAEALPPGAVTPATTVGTKRPCVACYISLYNGTGISPGPYWPSKAANLGFANYTLEGAEMLAAQIDTAVVNAGGTYASLELLCDDHEENIENGVHWNYNTDSDSDSDAGGADRMDTSSA